MNSTEQTETARVAAVILNSLDDEAGTGALARQAGRSRSNFYRLFRALTDENPGRMRRRILLERAAWQLAGTSQPVTEIAFSAGYGSLEAFARAFGRAFGVSPSLYRRSGSRRIHLPSANDFHYCPAQNKQLKGTPPMDLFDLFSGADAWYTRRLLTHAAQLNDEQLDRELNGSARAFDWEQPDRNLREILERMVQTREIWTAALSGGDMPALEGRPACERTPIALLERFEKTEAEFQKIMRSVRDRGGWDETFVDALCEPAETFTYGGAFADIVTAGTHRRLAALDAFQKLGAAMASSGSPIEYVCGTKG